MKKLLILPALLAILFFSIAKSQAQKIYDFVSADQQPTFPGGMAQFYNYLDKNIKYPAVAMKNKVQGNTFLTFIVEKDGSLTDVNVIRSLSKETDAEALRVVKTGPKWIPGKIQGKPVRVKYNINVKFKLT